MQTLKLIVFCSSRNDESWAGVHIFRQRAEQWCRAKRRMVQVQVHVLALVGVLCVVLENSVCAEQVPLEEMTALHDLYNST